MKVLYHSVKRFKSPIHANCEKRVVLFSTSFLSNLLTTLFFKRKISICTEELLVKIKASDDWLWQFSHRHGNAYRCTFGEGIGVPAV